MNHINVSITMNLTPDETAERLQSFFREYAPEAEMTFALRAPFDISALNVGLTLQREVTARFAPLSDSMRAFSVAWQPAAAGPFPAFAGTIYISETENEPNESIVTLDGHYHPPLGVAGDMFDAVVGRHIAQSSATDLLERVSLYLDGAPQPVGVFGASPEPVRAFSPSQPANAFS